MTISAATVLFTGLRILYRISGNNISSVWRIRSLTRERRKSDSEAVIFLTVAAASPGTIMPGRIKSSVDIPRIKMRTNTNAATLAVFWGELILSLVVIVFLLVLNVFIGG